MNIPHNNQLMLNKLIKQYTPIYNKMHRLEENIEKAKKEYGYRHNNKEMIEYRKIVNNNIQLYKPVSKN